MSVLCIGIIFLDVMYGAAISDSAAEAITFLMICVIVNMGPLSSVLSSFSERAFGLLINHTSACAANIISLFRIIIPSSGYVAT